jgi:hypothetical protein
MGADDPIEFGAWVERHRVSLNEYARALGGDDDDVARAIQRTLASDDFPANNDNLWRTWAEGAIRSIISTRARGAKRAERALETLGAIYNDGHSTLHHWPAPSGEAFVKPAGRCRRCGHPLSLRLEREDDEPWVEVFGCANGHRQYPEVKT